MVVSLLTHIPRETSKRSNNKVMCAIFAIHGVTEELDPSRFCHRNLLSTKQLRSHFIKRTKKYVSLADALAGRGEAITIDDGIVASARAAELAREYGHEVTLFLNPFNIETGRPLFFLVLNWMLDQPHPVTVTFLGREFSLSGTSAKRKFRSAIKEEYLRCSSEDCCWRVLELVREALEIKDLSVAPDLRTLTVNEVKSLVAKGVRIGNHGWSHVSTLNLEMEEIEKGIKSGQDWLANALGVVSSHYAVPFGEVMPTSAPPEGISVWLMLDASRPPGYLSARVFNRISLSI